MAKVAIIGGGISGLSAAYYLTRGVKATFDKVWLKQLYYRPVPVF